MEITPTVCDECPRSETKLAPGHPPVPLDPNPAHFPSVVPTVEAIHFHRKYVQHCYSNLQSLSSGATPSYYAPNCPDAMVNGVGIQLRDTPAGTLALRSYFLVVDI